MKLKSRWLVFLMVICLAFTGAGTVLAFGETPAQTNVQFVQWLVPNAGEKIYEFQIKFDVSGANKNYTDIQNGLADVDGEVAQLLKKNLEDYVYINGKSVGSINRAGVTESGSNEFYMADGTTRVEPIRANWADNNNDNYRCLKIKVHQDLAIASGGIIKEKDKNIVTIKEGMTLPIGAVVSKTVSYKWALDIPVDANFGDWLPTENPDLGEEAEKTTVQAVKFLVKDDSTSEYLIQICFAESAASAPIKDIQDGDDEELKKNIFEYVYINGKSIGTIIEQGKNKDGTTIFKSMRGGVEKEVKPVIAHWNDNNDGFFVLQLEVHQALAEEWGGIVQAENKNVITVKEGMKLPCGLVVESTSSYKWDSAVSSDTMWGNWAVGTTETKVVKYLVKDDSSSMYLAQIHFKDSASLEVIEHIQNKTGTELLKNLSDYVYINGKSVGDILANGQNKDGSKQFLSQGNPVEPVRAHWRDNNSDGYYVLHLEIHQDLAEEWGGIKPSGNTIEVKHGMQLPAGFTVSKDSAFVFQSSDPFGDWTEQVDAKEVDVKTVRYLVPSNEISMYLVQIHFSESASLTAIEHIQNMTGSELLKNLSDYVYINGKSVGDILANGLNKNGDKEFLSQGNPVEPIRAHWRDNGDGYYVLHLEIHQDLAVEWGGIRPSGNFIEVKEEMQLPVGHTVKTSALYEFTGSDMWADWVMRYDFSDVVYEPLEVLSISNPIDYANGNIMFNIVFNRAITYRCLEHLLAGDEWLLATSQAGGLTYTAQELEMLSAMSVKESIGNYILFNGKSLAQMIAEEPNETLRPVTIQVHLGQVGMHTMTIFFNVEGANKIENINSEMTFEFLPGMKTPLFNEIKEPFKFRYMPETGKFVRVTSDDSVSNEVSAIYYNGVKLGEDMTISVTDANSFSVSNFFVQTVSEKATYVVSGGELKEGENLFTISVDDGQGNKKDYTVKVILTPEKNVTPVWVWIVCAIAAILVLGGGAITFILLKKSNADKKEKRAE